MIGKYNVYSSALAAQPMTLMNNKPKMSIASKSNSILKSLFIVFILALLLCRDNTLPWVLSLHEMLRSLQQFSAFVENLTCQISPRNFIPINVVTETTTTPNIPIVQKIKTSVPSIATLIANSAIIGDIITKVPSAFFIV